MTTYRVYDIQWETDGEPGKGLPSEVTVVVDEVGSEDEKHEAAVNLVSDQHGWLIADCKIEAA